MTNHCPRDLTFPWQPYFDRHVFAKFQFLLFKKLSKGFLVTFFESFDHLMLFLFVLITFEPILAVFFF